MRSQLTPPLCLSKPPPKQQATSPPRKFSAQWLGSTAVGPSQLPFCYARRNSRERQGGPTVWQRAPRRVVAQPQLEPPSEPTSTSLLSPFTFIWIASHSTLSLATHRSLLSIFLCSFQNVARRRKLLAVSIRRATRIRQPPPCPSCLSSSCSPQPAYQTPRASSSLEATPASHS